jgi:aminoglycoside phosphotransferase family enzyme/predicted kinase
MSRQLINSILDRLYSSPGERPELIETHISWVILTGETAYKIKKPLNLGFLDFSSLEKRKTGCEAELRLNRRTAPGIYLEVVPISGTEDAPRVGDPAQPIEYAVKMVQFDHRQTLDHLIQRGELDAALIQSLARALASFHRAIADAPTPRFAGTTAAITEPVEDNFAALMNEANEPQQDTLNSLRDWCRSTFKAHKDDFGRRRNQGYVRECHGDLHLGNIVRIDNSCIPFDCIEFSDSLRWIDVACDIAFTIMDIEHLGEPTLAHLLLNEYLQWTGDYSCIGILQYYLVYRAMVRAKISMIRAAQSNNGTGRGEPGLNDEASHYLSLASHYARGRPARLVMMCGLSGSGKSTVAQVIAAGHHAICIRSDVERKRLFGLAMDTSSRQTGLDIYTAQASDQTFQCLLELAREILAQGFQVVVDATFIQRERRAAFAALADQMGMRWAIVHCQIDADTARQRLSARLNDASEAGFEQFLDQRRNFEDFDARERARSVEIDTAREQPSVIIGRLDGLFSPSRGIR